MKKINNKQLVACLTDGIAALESDIKKKKAMVYPFGFVPNAYRWPAPAERIVVTKNNDNGYGCHIEVYDRKRSHAKGSYITLWSQI